MRIFLKSVVVALLLTACTSASHRRQPDDDEEDGIPPTETKDAGAGSDAAVPDSGEPDAGAPVCVATLREAGIKSALVTREGGGAVVFVGASSVEVLPFDREANTGTSVLQADEFSLPAIAPTADGYTVVNNSMAEGVVLQRLDASGHTSGATVSVAPGLGTLAATVLWNGSEHAVAWICGSVEICVSRRDAAGVEVGSFKVDAGSGTVAAKARGIDLAWTGSQYAVAWSSLTGSYDVFAALVTPDGVESARQKLPVYAGATQPVIVWNGDQFAAVYQRSGVEFVRTDTALVRQEEPLVLTDSDICGAPEMVWNGSEYGVVYTCGASLSFARVSAKGALLQAETLAGPQMGVEDYSTPAIGWDGEAYVITWTERGDDGIKTYKLYSLRYAPECAK